MNIFFTRGYFHNIIYNIILFLLLLTSSSPPAETDARKRLAHDNEDDDGLKRENMLSEKIIFFICSFKFFGT
jgi:hypothetical protein